MQEEHQHFPNTDRLSVLAASILLAYSLLPFIKIPDRTLVLNVLGVVFLFKVNFATIISIITAALAAAGTSWLLRDHPHLQRTLPSAPAPVAVAASADPAGLVSEAAPASHSILDSLSALGLDRRETERLWQSFRGSVRSLFQHWLLPALTAWVIGVPLNSLAVGLQWWAVFTFGGVLLVLVLIAEYIAVDPYDTRHGPAAIGLIAVSYAMFLILTIALVAAGARLYTLIPALTGALFLVTLRNLHLRLGGSWCYAWSAGITLVVGQVATALHYWPISPLRFGLIIIGLAYALSSIAGSLEEGRSWRSLWLEPVAMLAALWGLAAVFGG